MRLATPSGLVTVQQRAWPMAGLDYPRMYGNGTDLLRLVSGPGGIENVATYGTVYRSNPWVYAAVQAYARGIGRLPLLTYVLDANGNSSRVRGDLPGSTGRPSAGQQLDTLLRFPEPGVPFSRWIRSIVIDRMVFGNALVEKDMSNGGVVPSAIWHVRWSRVRVEEGERVPILWYEIVGDRGSRKVSPLDVIHFGSGSDPDSPIGISPLAPMRATLALHDALWRHAVAYMENSARPSGLVSLSKDASEAVIEKTREQVRALYQSPENAGKVIVTSGTWQSMSDAPDQASLIDLAKLSREEIAAGYGIPQPILGILDKAILNNTRELRAFWNRDVVGPVAAELEDEIMAQLVAPNSALRSHYVAFDLASVLRPDPEVLGEIAERTRHVLTPNEQRRDFWNKAPIETDGADTLWMPAGQIGLGLDQPAPAPDDEVMP